MTEPRSFLTSLLLLEVLLLQTTVLPYTLKLKTEGRVLNVVVLAIFTLLAIRTMVEARPNRVSQLYVIAVTLVFIGYAVNITRSLSPETLGYAGLLLPWTAALSVPFMGSFSLAKSWAMFYRFMLVCSVTAGIEYVAFVNDQLAWSYLETPYGVFVKGIFSIFYQADNYDMSERMYGWFVEPGTFAMFLLPAIAYALVFRRRWALVVFLPCLVLTYSLGGQISGIVLVALFLQWRAGGRGIRFFVVGSFVAGAYYVLANYLTLAYSEKGASATLRETNALGFLANIFDHLLEYPFGMPLRGGSMSALGYYHATYLGSNFAPYVALVVGGIAALLGYSALLGLCVAASIRFFAGYNPDKHSACVFISLPPLLLFVFQRASILESAAFAFLFASPVIAMFIPAGRRVGQSAVRKMLHPRRVEVY